ncbi:YajG family lipoprotein [Volucribacter amazonae]|uniref:Lipoprotein n=1 Tax=Volucribacter amazonae TaxID=256731 RepID=A0A9X4PCB4_9PAST|nr:YajG family lipoprotein [Volucribacter amazonae]MDG6894946.1 hypothetical protein [Volucribacter amazonae]
MIKTTKSLALTALFIASLGLSACQNQTSTTLYFTPIAPNVQFNIANQAQATLNIVARDLRPQPEVASYVEQEKVIKLTSSPSVTQLFQQILQQDLNSKGFRITPPAQSNTNVIVNVKEFYANVEQGNLRYKITSKIQLEIQIQGAKGQFNKTMTASRTQEGVFSAKNNEIQNVLTATLNEITQNIYQDQEISQAIQQYSR